MSEVLKAALDTAIKCGDVQREKIKALEAEIEKLLARIVELEIPPFSPTDTLIGPGPDNYGDG